MKNTFKKISGIMAITTVIVIIISISLLFIFKSKIVNFYFYNNMSILFENDIYEISINVYIFFITIIFTLIGFSINKISKYNLTTRDFIEYLLYFGGTLLFFIILTISNIVYHFNDYIFPYNFISYILLISSFIVFFSLISFTIDTFQSENLFDFISRNTQRFIKDFKKEDKKHNKLMKRIFKGSNKKVAKNVNKVKEEFTEELNIKINILFENLISSIDKNDFLVGKKILDEIPNIIKSYLNETQNFFIKGDKEVAYNLNDNYNFVFDSIQNSYNEKLYEHLVLSISKTSIHFLENRKLIGLDSGYSIHFLATLENFFYKTFRLKRTSVCHLIIQEISKHILHYDRVYSYDHNPYIHYFDQIEKALLLLIKIEAEKKVKLSESHDYWANMVYRNIIITKRNRFIVLLEKILKFKYVSDRSYHIKRFFENFSKGFLEIKSNSRHLMVIFPCIFGIDSFVMEIAKMRLTKLDNDIQRINISNYLKNYLEFNKKIILTNFENNDSFVYQFYPEFVYYIINYIDIRKNDKDELVENVFDIIIKNMNLILEKEKTEREKNGYSQRIYFYNELKEKLVDSIAILLYNHTDFESIIKKILNNLLKFYSKLSKDQKEDIFPVMKLLGCWINHTIKIDKNLIQEYNKLVKEGLTKLDKEREDIRHRPMGTIFQEYSYFCNTFSMSQNGFWLYPSNLWGNSFQDKISKFFNSDLSIYEKYHIKIKGLTKKDTSSKKEKRKKS